MNNAPLRNEAAKMIYLSRIKDADVNPREHGEEQIEKLAEGILRFGFTRPVLVDEQNCLIAGHARCAAAKIAGMKTVPAIVAKGWTKDDKLAYLIADNKLAQMSGWDEEIIAEELNALNAAGESLAKLGFDEESLIEHSVMQPADEKPRKPRPPKRTKDGQLWRLGNHRMLVGKADDKRIKKAFPKDAPLMVTALNKSSLKAMKLFKGVVAYVWYAGNLTATIQRAATKLNLLTKYQIIWNHPNEVRAYSAALMVVRKGGATFWRGGRKQVTVWKPIMPNPNTIAPTEPRRRSITNHLAQDEYVFDPSADSEGDTLIAAELEKRRAYIIAPTPATADSIIERWESLTGKGARFVRP